MSLNIFLKTPTEESNMRNTAYNIYNLIIHDFFLIPTKLRKENRFCLWKYEKISNSIKKTLKKPYAIDSTNKIIPSLKDKRYWFGLLKLKHLNIQVIQEYGLGLILNDGPYIVIDLDNCIVKEGNKLILLEEAREIIRLFSNAYCEVSPSNTGLHIMFKGKWSVNCNKAKRYISKHLQRGTIEIYSGKDCRYVTLTGNSICDALLKKDLPYYSFQSPSLQKLYQDFFSAENSNDILKTFIVDPLLQQSHLNLNQKILTEQYFLMRKKILDSNLGQIYSSLCNLVNPLYASPSEADWSYFCLVLRFLSPDQTYAEKYSLLKYFYQQDRPDRAKKHRQDYIRITLEKVLSLPSFDNEITKIHESSQGKARRNSSIRQMRLSKVDKNNVLKICNTMKIFHLGKSVNNFQYINQNENNYLKVIALVSLNQNDLVNYFEILDQFFKSNKDSNGSLEYSYFTINVHQILTNTSKTVSGKSYQNFINTVDKLSHVILEYDKQIHTNGLRSKKVGSLLTYEYQYLSSNVNSNKKLLVRMHPSIVDILKESNYNYTIFNRKSFHSLEMNELKLLYYYFCLSTLPGSFSQQFSINDLLKLWPKSEKKQTLSKRKQALFNLLLRFEEKKEQIFDLDIILEKSDQEIIGVKVKKRHLDVI